MTIQTTMLLLMLAVMMGHSIYRYHRIVNYRNNVLTPIVESFIEESSSDTLKRISACLHRECVKPNYRKTFLAMIKEISDQDVPKEFENIVCIATYINHKAFRITYLWYKVKGIANVNNTTSHDHSSKVDYEFFQ
ncbi:hypothetical protein IHC87_06840 [Photobacterium damselae subsp. damselae]|uniref:hypothetical protein n=1 Tax=Photobacterium damselae TaxID=38293 RepID=UPI001F27B2F4|nr:hypothetical protein [Photobacterium damselae]UJZ95056.1 hypothetical protein IHC87_06840 [Photobacterium damselae subsp. damselae]UJZ99037.1 hypothetical protein IHC88_06830 [Photobacterium damselae subsp. damselae]